MMKRLQLTQWTRGAVFFLVSLPVMVMFVLTATPNAEAQIFKQLFGGQSRQQVKPQPVDVDVTVGSIDVEMQTLELINAERARFRLNPLSWAPSIHSDSRRSASIQNRRNTVGHPIGGPEISGQADSPERVVRAWMRSDGHRRMILSPNFTSAAVGNSGRFWSTRFTRDRDTETVATRTVQTQRATFTTSDDVGGRVPMGVSTTNVNYSPQEVNTQTNQTQRRQPLRGALKRISDRRNR